MPEPIRVLCVFAKLDRGGAESMCMNLYRHIDRSKVQFDFVKHTHEKGAFEDEIVSLGGRIFEAPQYKIYNHCIYTRWWKRHLTAHPEHTIIHAHYFTIASVYLKVAKKLSRKTLVHSHQASTFKKGENFRILSKIKMSYVGMAGKYADYAFACSKAAGIWLFKDKEYTVLNNTIDTSRFIYDADAAAEIRKKLGFTETDYIIGHVGRFWEQKNHVFLLDVFNELHKKDGKYKLLLVGGGPLQNIIEEKIREYDISDYVTLTGVRSDVNNLMMAMDIFVLPSLFEGLPVVAVEAQSTGLPCLIADTVTDEVVLTQDCKMLPLRAETWVQEIAQCRPRPHTDNSQTIIDAGYDIRTTAKWLQDFYIRIACTI